MLLLKTSSFSSARRAGVGQSVPTAPVSPSPRALALGRELRDH